MPEHNEHNAAATERLRALVEGLSAEDHERSLGGGWVVATALAHLAFWDGRQRAALEHFVVTGEQLGEEADDATNVGLETIWPAVEAAAAGRLVIPAAASVDAVAATLDEAQVAVLEAGGNAYQVHRHNHRAEHIDQIEEGLER